MQWLLCAQFHLEKTWESLFETLVKAFSLQQAKETLLIFDNYSGNQEFSLKQQEKINQVTSGTVRVYMGTNAQERPQGKAFKQYLENTGNKAELTNRFTDYIQQD